MSLEEKNKEANQSEAIGKEISQKRPWVRFWARTLDYSVFGLIGIIVVAMINPEISKIPSSQVDRSLSIIVPFMWIFIESFLLCTWGATPGKWLLRTYVRNANGQKLNYVAAFKRSMNVWVRGLILGLPLICVVGEIAAYNELINKGITSWDKSGSFVVTHKKIGLWRVLVTVLFFTFFLWLIYLGTKTS